MRVTGMVGLIVIAFGVVLATALHPHTNLIVLMLAIPTVIVILKFARDMVLSGHKQLDITPMQVDLMELNGDFRHKSFAVPT